MTKSFPLDLTPSTSLMDDIGRGNLASHEAIGELVANCFDSRPYTKDGSPLRLCVEIEVSDSRIVILDDAVGITAEWLPSALKLSEKREERGAEEKGLFGWGMKVSTSTLGYCVELTTRPIDHDYELYFRMPVDELAKGTASWSDLSFEQRSRDDDESPLTGKNHGTAIVVTKIRRQGMDVGELERHLQRTYAPHLKDGDVITLNGDKLIAWETPVFEEFRQEIDANIREGEDFRVHGWVGVGKTKSKGDYGLNIYRKNQLIEAWNKDAFTSKHQMTSRVVGEIHADFVPTNFNKKGFEKDSPEWKELVRFLKDELVPFLAASRELGKNSAVDMATKRAQQAQTLARQLSTRQSWKVSETGGWVEPPAPEPGGKKAPPKREEPDNKEVKTKDFPYSFETAAGEKIELMAVPSDLGADGPIWSFVSSNGKLQVVMNSSSEVYQQASNEVIEALQAVATGEAIQKYLVRTEGYLEVKAEKIRDEFITRALAKPR